MTLPRVCHSPQPLVVSIVDDDERNLKLAQDVLRAPGFERSRRSTGPAAIELAGRHLPT